jgi:MFS family permease
MKRAQLIFYGWFIVAIGILSYAMGYGARYSFSVIFPALLDEFHWPRDITALMLSVHMLVYGLVAPLAGKLVDRIGPRKTMTFGVTLLSTGLALSALGTSPWHFYATFGVLAGAGLCMIGAVPFTTVLRNWFEARRGLALSLLFFGAGSAFIWYPLIAYLIGRGGWRYTFVVEAGAIPLIMLPLIVLGVRYHPREKGLLSDGVLRTAANPSTERSGRSRIVDPQWTAVEWTLPKAVRTGRFWLVCFSTFSLWGIMQHIMVTHHVAFATDMGFTQGYASAVLSLFGIFFAAGCLAAFISDRIGREVTITLGTISSVSGIIVLIFLKGPAHAGMLYYYAATCGLGLGLSTPTIAAVITDIFQGPSVGATIGFVWFSFAVGGCIGPWLGGWFFEVFQSYRGAFWVAAGWNIVACLAIWFAAPRKIRLVPGRVKP